jgi:predicted transcriptional regulator
MKAKLLQYLFNVNMNDKTKFREKIISLLRSKGSLYLGDIAKEISVSPQSGYKFIEELMEEGIVMRQQGSLKITLA